MSERFVVQPDEVGMLCSVCQRILEVGETYGTTFEGFVEDIPVLMPTCLEHEGEPVTVEIPQEATDSMQVALIEAREEGQLE